MRPGVPASDPEDAEDTLLTGCFNRVLRIRRTAAAVVLVGLACLPGCGAGGSNPAANGAATTVTTVTVTVPPPTAAPPTTAAGASPPPPSVRAGKGPACPPAIRAAYARLAARA